MIFTLSTIFELLPQYDFHCMDPSVLDRRYKLIQLLPLESEDLVPDIVYVTDPYDPMRFDNFVHVEQRGGHNCLIYVYHADQVIMEGASVYLDTEDELAVVFKRLQEVIVDLLIWQNDLNSAANLEMDIPDMLNLTWKRTGNPMALLSPGYSLWASAGGEVPEDLPYTQLLRENHLSEETIQSCSALGYFPMEGETEETLNLLPPDPLSPYPRILLLLPLSRYATACLYCVVTHSRYLGGLADCIRMAGDALLARMKRAFTSVWVQGYELLMAELVRGTDRNAREIRDRAAALDIPFTANFLLLCSAPHQGEMPLEYCKDTLHRILPESFPLVWEDRVILLCRNMDLPRIQAMAGDFLEHQGFSLGVSNPFSTLTELRQAWDQACQALELSLRLQNSPFAQYYALPVPVPPALFYRYEDISVYHAYLLAGEHIPLTSLCVPAFLDLLKARTEKTTMIRVLYVFLLNECSYVNTARAVHMHRNNVVYHIGRIREMADFPLEDSAFRQRLLSSFQILMLLDRALGDGGEEETISQTSNHTGKGMSPAGGTETGQGSLT